MTTDLSSAERSDFSGEQPQEIEMQNKVRSSSATSGCSWVTDTPAESRTVQGTPDILTKISKAIRSKKDKAEAEIAYAQKNKWPLDEKFWLGRWSAAIELEIEVNALLKSINNTARDTKSSIAGVP